MSYKALSDNLDFILGVLRRSEVKTDWRMVRDDFALSNSNNTAAFSASPYLDLSRIQIDSTTRFASSLHHPDMASTTDPNPNFDFLMTIIASADDFKPNWKKANVLLGFSRADQPQQKFKKLIESTKKYALVNGKVVDLEDGGEGASAPATPAKRGRGGKATSTPRSSAGRKRKTKKDDSDDEESDAEGTPAKKRATPAKRGAAKKSAEKVKAEASDEEDEAATADAENGDSGVKNDDDGENEEGSGDGDGDAKEDAI
ncbi:hypothetical protein PMZ80_008412 [Knufia obscura]|uniref:Uncharacterized protein n=2 Tax=Knufia TaxID=430999 RepID=A0AAN8EI23_9EURO|nr:hypothetical protein PMZ80_008412 [Knufia obscura]KAK5951297.1 hypothetical protein OHC33_007715 [Knufia fluminis]